MLIKRIDYIKTGPFEDNRIARMKDKMKDI